MSILIHRARSSVYRDDEIVIVMENGSEIRFPVRENPRLANATTEELSKIEMSPYGVH
jgi:hypothetical protein